MKDIIIDEENKSKIIKILSGNLTAGIDVFAFGSRSKGSKKTFADLDLALKGSGKLPQSLFDKLNIEFEDSVIPFHIDLIDLNNIDSDFMESIVNDLVLFYSSK